MNAKKREKKKPAKQYFLAFWSSFFSDVCRCSTADVKNAVFRKFILLKQVQYQELVAVGRSLKLTYIYCTDRFLFYHFRLVFDQFFFLYFIFIKYLFLISRYWSSRRCPRGFTRTHLSPNWHKRCHPSEQKEDIFVSKATLWQLCARTSRLV